MTRAANDIEHSIHATGQALEESLQTIGRTTARSGEIVTTAASQSGTFAKTAAVNTGNFVGNGIYAYVTFVGRTIATGLTFTARMLGNGLGFVTRSTASFFGFVSNAPVVSAVIKPGANNPAPIIDPGSPTIFTARAVMPVVHAATQPTNQASEQPVWPIHGEITTLYGVPHWPYQPTHTGIDISSGRASGITAVKPFKSGKVIETVRAGWGLGNHVVVDHGGGITSVYAHLYAISVQVGQEVTEGTTLGLEGSTGASTGTHLHFEIRVHGQPTDPRPYLNGQP
jgi:hypothetical protein